MPWLGSKVWIKVNILYIFSFFARVSTLLALLLDMLEDLNSNPLLHTQSTHTITHMVYRSLIFVSHVLVCIFDS